MTNGPAITEENLVTSAAKSTRGQKSVPGRLAGTGTGASTRTTRPYCSYNVMKKPIIFPEKVTEGIVIVTDLATKRREFEEFPEKSL